MGRTLELSLELPYQISVFPAGLSISSQVEGHPELAWQIKHLILAVTMPATTPLAAVPFESKDLKVVEGLNDAGLTFSVQAYSQVEGPQEIIDKNRAALSAADIGTFILGQFTTVAEVKQALNNVPIIRESIAILGGLKMPFHYSVHDATGASLVIEFHLGVLSVYDNPVGVLTNAPKFSWHMTNLNNYTFLTNIDKSKANFLNYQLEQPGSGIAKIGLPGTDTSVDRFIRAVFYAQFAEKQTKPEKSVQMVAHIMNNFDRPRGITTDPSETGSGHMQIQGHAQESIPTEFTTWTSITDLDRRQLYLRDSGGMNYCCIDLQGLAGTKEFQSIPMDKLNHAVFNGTGLFATD